MAEFRVVRNAPFTKIKAEEQGLTIYLNKSSTSVCDTLRKISAIAVQMLLAVFSPLSSIAGLVYRYCNPKEADKMHLYLHASWNACSIWTKLTILLTGCLFRDITLLTAGFFAGSARLGFALPQQQKKYTIYP